MELLGKYDSEGDSPSPAVVPKAMPSADLESEWESFEKLLSSETPSSDTGAPVLIAPLSPVMAPEHTSITKEPLETEQLTKTVTDDYDPFDGLESEDHNDPEMPSASTAPSLVNPYEYLAYLTQSETGTDEEKAAAHAKLEEFFDQAAHAAAEAAAEAGVHSIGSGDEHSEHSDMEEDSESDSHSGSDDHHSISVSPEKDKVEKSKSEASQSTSSVLVKSEPVQKEQRSRTGRDVRPRHSGPTKRSRSRSRRSRSRSKHRRHRRSSSRSRHSGSRRRHRRSGSRHRRRRSRSTSRRRRSGSRHRSSRSRRGGRRRRSGSRGGRRSDSYKDQNPRARAPPPEDFKARMKRELQQAAKNALTKQGIENGLTPQQALMQTMAAMHAKAQELTGVTVPKYYNPAAVNPLKYAEQQQKRKLLWSKAAENKQQTLQKFQGTEVMADEKYRKLMGIKGDMEINPEIDEEQQRKQSELFAKLDQEYAMARLTTHTHRGMGLGVVSSMAAAAANHHMNHP